MMNEIIWTDKNTGQNFIIDSEGERIFIMADGSRVCESDLILEQMMAEYQEYEDTCRQEEEALIERETRWEEEETLQALAEEERRLEEDDCAYFYEQCMHHFDDFI